MAQRTSQKKGLIEAPARCGSLLVCSRHSHLRVLEPNKVASQAVSAVP
jgi:hypothetical protein